jgi:hypothetical protein
MPLMSSELFDALVEAGASDEKARKAAEAAAAYESRFGRIENDIALIKSGIQWLQVLLGVHMTMTMLILGKLFIFTGKP